MSAHFLCVMKFYPNWFMFFSLIFVGLVFILSGDNWFIIWVGFELTLMGFLPMFSGHSLMVEGLVKYFLVQAGGSSLFALSFLLPGCFIIDLVFMLSMFMKLGIFPFYSWVPLVMSSLTWNGCLFLVTVQKLGPLFVLCGQCYFCSNFLLFFSVVTILVAGLLGYNQSYMRALMSYSSISHTGWIIISFICSFGLFLCYLLVYFFLVGVLFSLFSLLGVQKVVFSGYGLKFWGVVNLLILTLSGVPPFSMFFLKMGVLYYMVGFYFFIPFLLFGSVISVYYYLTFVIPAFSVFWNFGAVGLQSGVAVMSVVFSFFFPFLLLL